MSTTIYLVRHADSVYSEDELNRPISHEGSRDANELYRQFSSLRVDRVYASPYKRAIETVEKIASTRALTVDVRDEFKERTKTIGKLDNFFENMAKLWADKKMKFPGGESNEEAQRRGVEALELILERDGGRHVVIGTHGDLMTLILNHYDASFSYEFWRKLDMPDAYKLFFEGRKIIEIHQVWARAEI